MALQLAALFVLSIAGLAGPGQAGRDDLAAFTRGVDAYVEMHRRLEGPLPPLERSSNMAEVRRLMGELRREIVAERTRSAAAPIFDRTAVRTVRARIAAGISVRDLRDMREDFDEHRPAQLAAPRLNAPLPYGFPFIPLPPRLLAALPALPAELRYVAYGKDLVLWDYHADLVVDIARGALDPATYSTTSIPD